MSPAPTTKEVIDLILQNVSAGSALEGGEGIEQIAQMLNQIAASDYVTVMVDQAGNHREYEGVEGFREALGDWITPYERFRLMMDEVIPLENKLLFLVRQVGTTKHGGVEIETPSGSVWAFQDGTLRQATFYIDPDHARRAAGLGPGESRG